jgi:hypothetical protein
MSVKESGRYPFQVSFGDSIIILFTGAIDFLRGFTVGCIIAKMAVNQYNAFKRE